MARGPRVLKKTVFAAVLKRLMRELKIDINQIENEAKIPYTTVWDWSNGVIPNSPDQLKDLLDFFKARDPNITLEYLYYGEDKDRDEMKKILNALKEKEKKLEFANAEQKAQLNFFQEIRNKEKIEKVKAKEANRTIETAT